MGSQIQGVLDAATAPDLLFKWRADLEPSFRTNATTPGVSCLILILYTLEIRVSPGFGGQTVTVKDVIVTLYERLQKTLTSDDLEEMGIEDPRGHSSFRETLRRRKEKQREVRILDCLGSCIQFAGLSKSTAIDRVPAFIVSFVGLDSVKSVPPTPPPSLASERYHSTSSQSSQSSLTHDLELHPEIDAAKSDVFKWRADMVPSFCADATIPGVPHLLLTISNSEFRKSWKLVIPVSPRSGGLTVTVEDVLSTLYEQLQKQVSRDEWEEIGMGKKDSRLHRYRYLTDAFQERCRGMARIEPMRGFNEMQLGVKRVDYLGPDNKEFAGLVRQQETNNPDLQVTFTTPTPPPPRK